MTTPQPAQKSAPRRTTSATLTAGVAVAGVLFAVALVLELAGNEPGAGEMTDVAAVADGLVGMVPWAWATLGAYAVVATPVVGLLVTGWEYWSVGDRRTVLLAAGVVGVLATSVLVAILR